jgi:ribonuclease HII
MADLRAADLAELGVDELRRRFLDEEGELPRGGLLALEQDPRAGARKVAEQLQRRRSAARTEEQRLTRLTKFERELWDQGVELVGGVDEVGMAPLAGPVIAAAVILPRGCRLGGVDDSKKLTPEEREELAPQIREVAVCFAIGRAEVEEIDRINIYQAGLLALKRAVQGLSPQPQQLLVDARKLDLPLPQQPIIKGDAKSLTIGAASIVAKVHRDRLMSELERDYPGYNFCSNKGYPTPDHLEALQRLGASAIHRRSFGPVARALGLLPEQQDLFAPRPAPAGDRSSG